ncbi:MAG: alpha-galactosidase, partial [Halanaerobiales bacterium]
MGISYNEKNNTFHLQGSDTSYVLEILNTGHLGHLYWGKKVKKDTDLSRLIKNEIRKEHLQEDKTDFLLDVIPQEYPGYGHTDFRQPAYHIQLENGSTVSNLKYQSHEIFKGKEELPGLPATYVEDKSEAETLKITLLDEVAQLKVVLSYTVYENLNVITRSARFFNESNENINLKRALSTSVNFQDADFDFLHLDGAWSRERYLKKQPVEQGIQSIESTRGASSAIHNPFIALARKNADENQGEVYGFSLVYSGNFLAQIQVNTYNQTRVSMGINPFDFNWLLEPAQDFQTPEVVMVYADKGLNQMSQTYHKLYRTRLARGKYREKPRPLLINNWEATYFDFDEEKILEIAETGKDLGLELFVLDDGWFGKRNDDTTSLGDWYVNKNKLPNGLDGLGNKINNLGMKFGLWFEPEMVSPDSELYRKHPDWCIHVPERPRTESRNQLILDLSRKEVQNKIIEMLTDILGNAPISYVKWDMNRKMTEIGSAKLPPERQRELPHRYMLGLYEILETLTSRFPNILFESCASGGARFDPGMLYYMPQTWTSDNTDAIERLKIQYGTSIVYPLSSIGAHISAVPNHQVGRITPLKTRADVAMFGTFGYELDLTELSEKEKKEVKKQVKEFKDLRELVQQGKFYRLMSPFKDNNDTAWMVVSENKDEAFVGYYKVLSEPNSYYHNLKLKGLDPEKNYEISKTNFMNEKNIYGGDELMYAGLNLPKQFREKGHNKGDFQSLTFK